MLNIVALVKQVPNTTQVKIDPKTNNLVREGVPSIVNPYDLFAVEEAIRLREQYGGRVTVLSMGPRQALEVVKYSLAMGADEGILLSDRAFAGADTLATSYTLSVGIRAAGPFDLIITGKQAADGDTAQVPAELSCQLGIGCLTYISRILNIENQTLTAVRTMDFAKVKAAVRLPAVVTVNKGINEPRFPRLCDMVRAMNKEVKIFTVSDLEVDKSRISLEGSPTQVIKVFSPERKKSSFVVTGSTERQCEAIFGALRKQEVI